MLALSFLAVLCSAVTASADTNGCEELASLKLANTVITRATSVPAGSFLPQATQAAAGAAAPNDTPGANAPAQAAAGGGAAPIQVPAFCRVQLTVEPSIKIEVWLPASGRNANFKGVGNGGWAGTIAYAALGTALRTGYATASTDTGHEGGNANFALGASEHPEILNDFGYRAIHEMTVKGKEITQAFYSMSPRMSYFEGCSQGGRQALAEAQRYPEDYNGILAGAPAIDIINHMTANFLTGYVTTKDNESYIPASKLAAIQDASVAACDMTDGLKDGLVSDPRLCHFDPAVLVCRAGDTDACLTAKQVTTLKNIYAGFKFPDGKYIYEGKSPGSERGWANFTSGRSIGQGGLLTLGLSFMRNIVFSHPNWDLNSWNTQDLTRIGNPKLHSIMDASNPDLRAFRDHSSKLILYQGWSDDAISAIHVVNYYKVVVATIAGVGKGSDAYTPEGADFDNAAAQTGNFFRLYLFPGMNHCGGGSGPNVFKGADALVNWVEHDQAPDQIIASHVTNTMVDRTRPVCPYPQTAQYKGQGSIDDAANFSCKLPKGK
jgi:feruloyl esterase